PNSKLRFLSFLLILLTGCTNAPQPPAAQEAKRPSTLEEQIGTAIHENYGPQISYSMDLKPSYLEGDFNGDGLPDFAALVDAENGRTELNDRGVIVLNVEPSSPENGRRIQPSSLGRHCFGVAILH